MKKKTVINNAFEIGTSHLNLVNKFVYPKLQSSYHYNTKNIKNDLHIAVDKLFTYSTFNIV